MKKLLALLLATVVFASIACVAGAETKEIVIWRPQNTVQIEESAHTVSESAAVNLPIIDCHPCSQSPRNRTCVHVLVLAFKAVRLLREIRILVPDLFVSVSGWHHESRAFNNCKSAC